MTIITSDEQKIRVLDAMRRANRAEGHWLSLNQISAYADGMGYLYCKSAVYALAADGWLNLRDPDTENQLVLIQLRKEYRK